MDRCVICGREAEVTEGYLYKVMCSVCFGGKPYAVEGELWKSGIPVDGRRAEEILGEKFAQGQELPVLSWDGTDYY
ncbi:hypothetical protein [Microbulbifer yueqingensis]|uniref:Uncharacterized protein n=1 Tax=Microbulbifer yueqingensis TaxID=658219 RepID=A0A1G9ANW4_9GAMM|nr:hypothetical protein [Microbulbifer yueqingensis]SDK29022.1 hypothetical protein SAMN05216212_2099 [Microbulbifer yueqingensis]